jgi:glycine cleavage system aminomethyltransferase T
MMSTYRNRSDDWHGIALSGPKSRMLLARLTRDDVGADSLKFRDLRQCFVRWCSGDFKPYQLFRRIGF